MLSGILKRVGHTLYTGNAIRGYANFIFDPASKSHKKAADFIGNVNKIYIVCSYVANIEFLISQASLQGLLSLSLQMTSPAFPGRAAKAARQQAHEHA